MMKITPQAIYNLYSNAIRNPKYRNWIIIGTLIYVLSPIDLSPDIFPLAGQIDDFLLLSIMAIEVTQMVFNSQKKEEEEKPSEKTVDVDAVSMD